jgi:hypothetical protein
MQRRELLRLLASAGATPLLASLAHASGADSWQAGFEASDAAWNTEPMKITSSFCASPMPAHRISKGMKAEAGR